MIPNSASSCIRSHKNQAGRSEGAKRPYQTASAARSLLETETSRHVRTRRGAAATRTARFKDGRLLSEDCPLGRV